MRGLPAHAGARRPTRKVPADFQELCVGNPQVVMLSQAGITPRSIKPESPT